MYQPVNRPLETRAGYLFAMLICVAIGAFNLGPAMWGQVTSAQVTSISPTCDARRGCTFYYQYRFKVAHRSSQGRGLEIMSEHVPKVGETISIRYVPGVPAWNVPNTDIPIALGVGMAALGFWFLLIGGTRER
jgi:hypothetical protein